MKKIKDKFDITLEDLTLEMYEHHRSVREMEHQLGRLFNMNRIFKKVRDNNIPGDFIEFGVHQGFSLLWMARFRDLYDLNDRDIIGIDSFAGLPEDGNLWSKGQFSDTGVDIVNRNLNAYLTTKQNNNINIIKAWFDDANLPKSLNHLSVIHMDCDLKSSLRSALHLISPYIRGTQYILLDDWGITEKEIPEGFNEWRLRNNHIDLELFSKTNITRYYKSYTGGVV